MILGGVIFMPVAAHGVSSGVGAAWVTAAAALATALGALLLYIGRWLLRITRRAHLFFDDWDGEPHRPGVPGRPGVMQRLATVEETLGKVLTETSPNGGKSLRDAVNNIQVDVGKLRDEIQADVGQLRTEIEALRQGKAP